MIRADHFVFAVPELEKARHEFYFKTGVLPEPGGQHLKLGTHNALVSLGNGMYLEFLAIDPTLDAAENEVTRKLNEIETRTFFGWALQCNGFLELKDRLQVEHLELSEITAGSRQKKDGSILKYEFSDILGQADPHVPFIIRWLDSVHPSKDSPQGIKLARVTVPGIPSVVRAVLKSMSLGVQFEGSGKPKLELETPKSLVSFE